MMKGKYLFDAVSFHFLQVYTYWTIEFSYDLSMIITHTHTYIYIYIILHARNIIIFLKKIATNTFLEEIVYIVC